MKTLYLIGGTMGVGKTTVSQQLKKDLINSVFLDGDWCWDSSPFQVTEETKKMVCTRVIDQNGIKMDLRYEATYTGDVVSLLESTEKVISSDTAVLEQYQTLLKQSYAPYDNVKYYNVDITIDGDTLTSHVVVNADKIDVDEITKIDSANGNYYTDGKMMIANVERAFTSLGATCTTE